MWAAWVHRSERRAEAVAEVRTPDGTVTATGRVILARPPAEIAEGWAAEREHWRVDCRERILAALVTEITGTAWYLRFGGGHLRWRRKAR